MSIFIHGESYDLHRKICNTLALRDGFIVLARKSFGIDFQPWFTAGFWTDSFLPYVLTHQDQVVAAVCVHRIPITLQPDTNANNLSSRMESIQIGGVMTEKAFRGRGLSRYLMEAVLQDGSGKADLVYLYANDEVLQFYPKFGFEKAMEYQVTISAFGPYQNKCLLNPFSEADRAIIQQCYQKGNPYAAFQIDNLPLLMFYALHPPQPQFYYLPQYQTIIIAKFTEGSWLCYDIFGSCQESLPFLLGCLQPNETLHAQLGFTPLPEISGEIQPLLEPDTTLFVLKDKYTLFLRENVRMPLLSRA